MYEFTDRCKDYLERVQVFMDRHVYPAEQIYAEQTHVPETQWDGFPPILQELKAKAKAEGLWNMFIAEEKFGPGLSNYEFAPIMEILGRTPMAPEVFNCAAPDVGNMEVLAQFGNEAQQERWLTPLLDGQIRSVFCMTEPNVASSDATNIETSIDRDGDEYVINGRKWWSSGIGHPKCEIAIVMGKNDPTAERHKQQSMVLVPTKTPGLEVVRMLPVFGYEHAPHGHGEVLFKDVRVPVSNMLLGEGRGFEIAQGRLGPGRIHHCMRLIGKAERALEEMMRRAKARVAFGKPLAERDTVRADIANSRCEIDQARLLVLNAAWKMDKEGNKGARKEIAMIKVVVPLMAQGVLDRAIQIHGGGGVSDDFGLAHDFSEARYLRIGDGPDEVHREAIAKLELRSLN